MAVVDSALVDRGAPEQERVRFDREALRRVSDLYKLPATQDQVIRSWREVVRLVVNDGNLEHGLAAMALQDRLKGNRDVAYELVDGVWGRHSRGEINDEDDPWMAERNW